MLKKLLSGYFFMILVFNASAQNAQVFKIFKRNVDPFISEKITLSTDSIFFYSSPCECGKEYFAKGKWEIRNNILYLNAFDSAQGFPETKVSYFESDKTQDSVKIQIENYFGKPADLFIGTIQRDGKEGFPESLKNGSLILSKKDYSAIYLMFEVQADSMQLANEKIYHQFGVKTKEINIKIKFADADFFVTPILFGYGQQKFKIKNGNLYDLKGRNLIFTGDK